MRVFSAGGINPVDDQVFYPAEIYGRIIPVVCVERDKIVFGMSRKIFYHAVYRISVYMQPVGKTAVENYILYFKTVYFSDLNRKTRSMTERQIFKP